MSEKIAFMDLKRQYAQIADEVAAALCRVCEQTAFSGGPFVQEFEQNFARYCHAGFALAVNSGTVALHFAMLALGIGSGDEVIVPANTFIATAWGPSHAGATPVFVDCTADTWNLDPSKIVAKITPKTKAIIGVHLYGQPFDIDAVAAIARQHDLSLVEDCAQAHGARYKGKTVGALAEMGCFSFYPGKNLGAYGEGGAVTGNSEKYAKMVGCLRDHGSKRKYYHDMVGYNERMDGFQGAILNVKLKYIEQWTQRRRQIAQAYRQGITNSKITMQHEPEWAESVYHLFVITTDDRERLQKHLQENAIFPGMHYPVPCHLQRVYAHLGYRSGDFSNAEYLADHCLSLPMFPELTDSEVGRIIAAINNY